MTEARPILSNARAYLPTTQNSNEVQQKKAPAPLYFGGDEVDEVILSNQEEEQKAQKKKTCTIVGAVLGAIALATAAFVGLSATGCTNKGADSLKGFTQLTKGEGESATKLATIAKTDKSWTGATWGGVAETIKTTLNDSNNKFDKIVIVATADNQKKLEEKLGTDFLKKFKDKNQLIFKTENDFKDVADNYGKNEKTLILVDSSKDDWFDKIQAEITKTDNDHSSSQDKPAENKPDENKPAENKPDENKPAENKPAENKPDENKPAENKPAENKPAENKPAENKPAENKPDENKPDEEEEQRI